MKAIILAAGRGSRMKGLTEDRPKGLVEYRGRPLIAWQVQALTDAGISEIGIVTGYRREAFQSCGLREFFNPRWAETNMVASLACAHDWLTQTECLVSYSDIFYEAAGIRALSAAPADIAIAYDPDWLIHWRRRFTNPLIDAETFKLGDDGMLREIGCKPQSVEEIEGQYMGLLKISPMGWTKFVDYRLNLPPARADKIDMTSTLNGLIRDVGVRILSVAYKGEWGEIDTEEDLAAYSNSPIACA